MKIKILLIFFFLNFCSFAQEDKDLKGTWIFEGVYADKGEEEKSLAIREYATITFFEGSKYTSQFLGISQNGSYSIVDKTIQFTNLSGDNYVWQIIKFNDDELVAQHKNTPIKLSRKN